MPGTCGGGLNDSIEKRADNRLPPMAGPDLAEPANGYCGRMARPKFVRTFNQVDERRNS
jgi:hypothetical protein